MSASTIITPVLDRIASYSYEARRRLRWALISARMAIDALLINLAFALAWWARYELELLRGISPEFEQPLSAFLPLQAAITIVMLAAFYFRGLYAQPRGAPLLDQIGKVAGGALTAIAIVIIGSLLFSPVLPSRLIFVFIWVAVVLVFSVERFAIKQVRTALWRRGINTRRALVVGSGEPGQRIMKDIIERTDLGYELAGYVEDSPQNMRWKVAIQGNKRPSLLGGIADVDSAIGAGRIDEVIVALPANCHEDIMGVIERCRHHRIAFRLVPDLFEIKLNEVQIDALNGVPLIGVKEVALQGTNLWIKRTIDVVLAMLVLALASPLMGIVALLIMLEKPRGFVLFTQPRVGRGGRMFTCYKFRSMIPDADLLKPELIGLNEVKGAMFKMRRDPRVTRIGSFLRRTSIDELPQIFNILIGDMSWVGPRPQVPQEVEQYNDHQRRRLEATPGLTGLWQISGRSELSFEEMVELDLYYAENWSLLFDLKIILRTIPAVLKGKGAF